MTTVHTVTSELRRPTPYGQGHERWVCTCGHASNWRPERRHPTPGGHALDEGHDHANHPNEPVCTGCDHRASRHLPGGCCFGADFTYRDCRCPHTAADVLWEHTKAGTPVPAGSLR